MIVALYTETVVDLMAIEYISHYITLLKLILFLLLEENVVLQLDLLRNRILRFELFLSISTFVVSCGALVAGLLGMNLLNHFEGSQTMFYIVCSFTIVGMFVSFISFRRYGRREKLF
jgi:hypothetical protein